MLWRVPTRNVWNPWAELERLHEEMNRTFRSAGGNRAYLRGEFPAVNIWVKDDDAILTAELPGIDPEKIDITVKNDTVTVRGESEVAELGEGETYLRQERGAGSFVRSFALPFKVDPESVSAQYQKGILQVILPRAEEDKPKRIAIKAA